MTVDDIGIDEVLDYVSPYELERFETQQFEEEIEMDRIVQEAANAEAERKLERRKLRAQRKGVVIFQDLDDDPAEPQEPVDAGKYGRARPTYKHMFKKMKQRQRRKRDPLTGELMPLSGDEDEGAADLESSSGGEQLAPATTQAGLPEPPKRRRRKRDPHTGALLPLDPEPQQSGSRNRDELDEELALGVPYKRPRRRRHPITGELMPLGWRYDPKAEDERRGSGAGNASVESMRRSSIVREPEAKRPRLASASASSSDPRAQSVDPLRSFTNADGKQPTSSSKSSNIVAELNSSSLDESEDQLQRPSPTKPTPTGKTSMMQPNHKSAVSSAAASSRADSSPEPITLASFLKSSKKPGEEKVSSDESSSSSSAAQVKKMPTPGKTSIMNPTGSQTAKGVEEDTEEDDLDEDEYIVESILDHHWSDPRSHPGKESTLLYKTKWEGFPDPTWEPAESFPDVGVIASYRKHAGLDQPEKTQISTLVTNMQKKEATAKGKADIRPFLKTAAAPQKADTASEDDDEDEDEDEEDEEAYEVERILAHQKSDPRTHPGKPIAMLYQTKWKGYAKPTWEPADSFTDRKMLHDYQRKAGLRS